MASEAQKAVRLFGQRLWSVGNTDLLIKTLRSMGKHTEAESVRAAVIVARSAAYADYKAARKAIDPDWVWPPDQQRKELL